MKKLVFMFVAMAAISFASCGGSDKAGAANDSIDSAAADSAAADSAVMDTVAADSVAPAAADSAAQA
ncbi:MAG: entericidin [Alloprevotella sp.]